LPTTKITFFVDGAKQLTKKGPLLFTHFGLSGPTILNAAAQVGDLLHTGFVTAAIDVFPDTDHGALDKQLVAVFDANKNKLLKNVIGEFLPTTMQHALWLLIPTLQPDTKVHRVTKEQRKILVQTLKALPITITGLMGFDKAVVVDGGVPLTEIDTKTMRSKLFENLFITGDLLHINRPSGGFSLQLCWTTGFVAGNHAAS
jgi:predicted Rossmann fold flavoprotein